MPAADAAAIRPGIENILAVPGVYEFAENCYAKPVPKKIAGSTAVPVGYVHVPLS